MQRLLSLLCASSAGWLCASSVGCPTASDAPEPPTPEAPADLAVLLAPLRDAGEVPALVAGVTDRDRLLALGAVGVRVSGSTTPILADDPLHLGSNTKAMTATLAATFVDGGTLSWDAPIPSLFPGVDVDLAWSAVTFGDLLSHHAGIDDQAALGPIWPTLTAQAEPPRALRATFAAGLLADAPSGAIGGFAYSNAGYMLAGAALERLADEAWETLIAQRLWAPLGMSGCGFGAPGTDVDPPDAPWGHSEGADGWIPVAPGPAADNPPALGPAGTVRCPPAAWAAFARLHLGAGDLVSAATLQRMHTDDGDGYGFGWNVVPGTPGGLGLQHGGSNTMWNSDLWVFPEVDRAYFSVTNAYGATTFDTLDATIVTLIEEWPWE